MEKSDEADVKKYFKPDQNNGQKLKVTPNSSRENSPAPQKLVPNPFSKDKKKNEDVSLSPPSPKGKYFSYEIKIKSNLCLEHSKHFIYNKFAKLIEIPHFKGFYVSFTFCKLALYSFSFNLLK